MGAALEKSLSGLFQIDAILEVCLWEELEHGFAGSSEEMKAQLVSLVW